MTNTAEHAPAMTIDCRAEFTVDEPGDAVHVVRVRDWLSGLPDGAVLVAIMRDLGTQRDPRPTLIGLRATWSEQRR